jgi:hypothetical protein
VRRAQVQTRPPGQRQGQSPEHRIRPVRGWGGCRQDGYRVLQIGQLLGQFAHRPIEIAHRLLESPHILIHAIDSRRQPGYRCLHLGLHVLKALLQIVLDYRHAGSGRFGGIERLLHQHGERRELLILRFLQKTQLLLQASHVAL